jgi:peptide/nickel transport system permease protein
MNGEITSNTPPVIDVSVVARLPRGRSLWKDAFYRFKKNRVAVICLGIVVFYALIALGAAIGLIANPWDAVVAEKYQPPSLSSIPMWMGTDFLGRSVFYKTLHGARIALSVGLISSLLSTPVGLILGALAGYFGGILDDFVVWLYTVLSSVPNFLLLMAITYVLGKGMGAMYVALSITAWVSLARVIRGEVIKHKSRDYVVAAESLGASHFSRIFKHIIPNVSHFMIVNLSIQFIYAIKSEVILSFLGMGAVGQPSWGVMIDDAKMELTRSPSVWWQLAAATVAVTVLLLAFTITGDAMRDALDPKVK